MQNIMMYLSDILIPLIIGSVIVYGLIVKVEVYNEFIIGAKKGFTTVIHILPTLIGLMVAVGILRASGFLSFLSVILEKIVGGLGFPTELVPITVVKMFSSSAATGLLLDLYSEHGVDSQIGMMASIMLSSTETIFYTMSVYFMSVKVTKTRWTLAGALVSSMAGVLASVWLGRFY